MSLLKKRGSGLAWLLILVGALQLQAETRSLEIQSIVHDPLRRAAELYVTNDKSKVVPLALRPRELSAAQKVQIVDGFLRLYTTEHVDPEAPTANLGAAVRVADSIERALVVFFPAEEEGKFKGLVIDDSPGEFAYGESRFVNATAAEIGVMIGEHKLAAKPGQVKAIPAVRQLDDFNMAQTDFHFRLKSDDAWNVFSQRRLKFVESQRRIFVASVSKRASAPAISTIVDMKPVVIPKK
ncbi:hypothetical protein [Roseibacillus persicicus]|uniref:hypothetical protein n=1 Tax=Roseibacillus persicicus TaxID=454148 RepID=UPI001671BBA9|nr:hypothetical protein [Roseibacillus persicicus]MDQ8189816.1 hypothetical protein [Roseibacillus persicicus]